MSSSGAKKHTHPGQTKPQPQSVEQPAGQTNYPLNVAAPVEFPDYLFEFLGAPPIVRGEDPIHYNKISSKVAAVVGPVDEIEWLWVKDVSDALWLAQRYRRMRDQIYELRRTVAIKQVVKTILQENATDASVGIKPQADKLVSKWVKNGPEGEAQMLEFLAQYGLDSGAILAEIFLGRSQVFDQLERMAAANDKRRDAVIREIERRRATRAPRFREAAEIAEAESEDLPVKNS